MRAADSVFAQAVKHAVHIIAAQLELDKTDKSYEPNGGARVTEDWFGHIVAKEGQCDCLLHCKENDEVLFSRLWYISPCELWRDDTYRRAWYCEWFGITLEQLAASERAEQEMAAMNDKDARRRRVANLKAQIERELSEYNVVITLPPH